LPSSLTRFREASSLYRPADLRLLFIAEAPPSFRVNRLFYFTGLREGDTLFLEMMKVLYPATIGFADGGFAPGHSVKRMREGKAQLLERFQRDGNFLLDACERPMPEDADSARKARLMGPALPSLLRRVHGLIGTRPTPVILIGGITFAVCAEPLRQAGIHVAHAAMINHPARGGQVLFRKKLGATLKNLPR
jgi:hypothetical protein